MLVTVFSTLFAALGVLEMVFLGVGHGAGGVREGVCWVGLGGCLVGGCWVGVCGRA